MVRRRKLVADDSQILSCFFILRISKRSKAKLDSENFELRAIEPKVGIVFSCALAITKILLS